MPVSTYEKFARIIRKNNPEYNDLTDDKRLSEAFIKANPEYSDFTFLAQKKDESVPSFQRYQQTATDVSGAAQSHLAQSVSRAAGGFTDFVGRGVAFSSRLVGEIGSRSAYGAGEVVSIFSDDKADKFYEIGNRFKKNQDNFAKVFQDTGTRIGSYLTQAGEEHLERELADNQGYQSRQIEIREREQSIANRTAINERLKINAEAAGREYKPLDVPSDFQLEDLSDFDFWAYDIWAGD